MVFFRWKMVCGKQRTHFDDRGMHLAPDGPVPRVAPSHQAFKAAYRDVSRRLGFVHCI